jgi:hypothetical protein
MSSGLPSKADIGRTHGGRISFQFHHYANGLRNELTCFFRQDEQWVVLLVERTPVVQKSAHSLRLNHWQNAK